MEEKTSTHHYSAESSKRSLALVFAASLIVLGFFGLLGAFQIIVITWEKVWPLFLLVPGLIFEISYFRNKKLSHIAAIFKITLVAAAGSAVTYICTELAPTSLAKTVNVP